MKDDLAVALRRKRVALREQRLPELDEIVDLSIEHQRERPVFVKERLVAAGDVDDAQPPHSEADALAQKKTGVVRPAMAESAGHRLQRRLVDGGGAAVKEAGDAAH